MKIPRTLIATGILVLFLVSFSEAPRMFAHLNVSLIKVLSSGDLGMIFRQARTSRAGEHILPPPVQASISLLRANRVTSYRSSPALWNIHMQRLVEGAYPLRYEEHAHYLLLLEQESPDRNCSQVSRAGGVILVYCP